jgi:hypothetical protein
VLSQRAESICPQMTLITADEVFVAAVLRTASFGDGHQEAQKSQRQDERVFG